MSSTITLARILFSLSLALALLCITAAEASAQSAPCQSCGNWQSPVAAPSGPYVATTSQSITFDASESWSFDGPIVYYHWDFGDGTYATGPNPNHQYSAEGVYTVTLTVCDDLWNCASSESYATAGAVNVPARINFDELSNNTIISDQFQPYFNAYGVRFSTDNPLYPVRTWNNCGFCSTTSPPNFIEAGPNNQGQTIVEFAQPVNNLTFYMVGVDAFFNQFAVIDVYRDGVFYASYPVYGNGRFTVGFTFGSLTNISRVVIRSITDASGIGYTTSHSMFPQTSKSRAAESLDI